MTEASEVGLRVHNALETLVAPGVAQAGFMSKLR